MNRIAQAFEDVLEQGRPGLPWAAIVVALCIVWFVSMFIPWAAAGFPVVG